MRDGDAGMAHPEPHTRGGQADMFARSSWAALGRTWTYVDLTSLVSPMTGSPGNSRPAGLCRARLHVNRLQDAAAVGRIVRTRKER